MIKVGVMFGGKSTEHDISVISGTSVISNLDKKKYEIYPIYIDRNGEFYEYKINIKDIVPLKIDDEITEIKKINNIFKYLENIDIVFPVLHGLNGEDGSIQGMLEIVGKKYVGCKILSSSLCMDKVYAKALLRSSGIDVCKSMYVKKIDDRYIYIDEQFNRIIFDGSSLEKFISEYLNYPVFVKPSNSGSSVGVNKVNSKEELINYLEESFIYDTKVLIEEAIVGREVECAILGNNDNPIASYVGEVLSADDFYSYDSKYKNSKSLTIIPADIDGEVIEEIRKIAVKAYQVLDCSGLSRVDFFIEKDTNRIILNEINTMPGFTEISMYPKLMQNFGYDYSNLLDTLINYCL